MKTAKTQTNWVRNLLVWAPWEDGLLYAAYVLEEEPDGRILVEFMDGAKQHFRPSELRPDIRPVPLKHCRRVWHLMTTGVHHQRYQWLRDQRDRDVQLLGSYRVSDKIELAYRDMNHRLWIGKSKDGLNPARETLLVTFGTDGQPVSEYVKRSELFIVYPKYCQGAVERLVSYTNGTPVNIIPERRYPPFEKYTKRAAHYGVDGDYWWYLIAVHGNRKYPCSYVPGSTSVDAIKLATRLYGENLDQLLPSQKKLLGDRPADKPTIEVLRSLAQVHWYKGRMLTPYEASLVERKLNAERLQAFTDEMLKLNPPRKLHVKVRKA